MRAVIVPFIALIGLMGSLRDARNPGRTAS